MKNNINSKNIISYSDFIYSKPSNNSGNTLLDSLLKIDNVNLPIGNIKFSDDLWDFSKYITLNINKGRLRFKFDIIPDVFKNNIKFFIISEILKDICKLQSINRKFKDISIFLNYLYDSNIFKIEDLTLSDIKKYIDIKNDTSAPTTIKNMKTYLKQYLYFYYHAFKVDCDKSIMSFLETHDSNYINAYKENNKFPDIPEDYLDKLLSLCMELINDNEAPHDDRVLSAVIILFSQTGIRRSNLFSLKTNSLAENSILSGKKVAYYLNYEDFKKERGNNSYTIENVFLNELSLKSYKLLEELCSYKRNLLKTDILIVPNNSSVIPVDDSYFTRKFIRFSLKYHKKLDNINNDNLKDLSKVTIETMVKNYCFGKSSYEGLNLTDIVSFPTAHQFRVHLCTQLYRKGVPLNIIQKHMTHLSADMQDYYIRANNDSEKKLEYSKSVLKTVLKDEANLIGGNKDALMKKIHLFIEKGNFNIEKDIDDIVENLSKKIPIKEKLGGICIKSGPKRDCRKDAMTDEFYCAYGICPNHFHLYTMIDITYGRYLNLIKTMNFNKENGFLRQSEKEKFKLICLIRDSLIPELNELKKEISKNGAENISTKHPHLEYFINNFDIVYKEASQWLN